MRPGDTLSSIADHFGTSAASIASANHLQNRNVVVVGRHLTIPAAATGTTVGYSRGVLPAKLRAHPDRLALRPLFVKWGAHYGVPADLLEATAWIESGWQTGVVSKTGAIGVGQLQPATIDFVRLLVGMRLNPYSANDNIRMSARFMRYLLDRTNNNVALSLAAYYQGLRSISTRPVLPDTMQYVAAITAVRPAFA